MAVRKHTTIDSKGNVTTRTTYSHKDILGVRHSATYVQKQSAEELQRMRENVSSSNTQVSNKTTAVIGAIIFLFSLIIIAKLGEIALFLSIPIGGVGLTMIIMSLPTTKRQRNNIHSEPIMSEKTENGWICPECGTENSNSTSSCKDCGRYK